MATGGGIETGTITAPPVPSAPAIPAGPAVGALSTPGIASEIKGAAIPEAPVTPTLSPVETPPDGATHAQQAGVDADQRLQAISENAEPGARAAEVAKTSEIYNTPAAEAGLPAEQATNPDVAVEAAPNPGTTEPAEPAAPAEANPEDVKLAEAQERVDASMNRILQYREGIKAIDAQLGKTTDLDLARQLHWQKQGLENDLRIEQAHYAKERLKQQMETAAKEGAKSQIAQDVEARVSRDYNTLPEAVTSQIAPLIAEAMQALLNDLSKNQETTLEQELPDQRAESVTAMDLIKAVIKFFLKLVIQAMIDQEILAAEKQRAQQQAQPGTTAQPAAESGGATQAEQGVTPPPATTETPVAPVSSVVNAPVTPAAPVVAPTSIAA